MDKLVKLVTLAKKDEEERKLCVQKFADLYVEEDFSTDLSKNMNNCDISIFKGLTPNKLN